MQLVMHINTKNLLDCSAYMHEMYLLLKEVKARLFSDKLK